KVVNFGSVMNELFEQKGRKLHRDHMRRQDIGLQSRVQLQAARRIKRMAMKEPLIVDTHMFVRTTDGLWPGTPQKVLEELSPDAIILIEAKPEEIAKRRRQDTTRERETNAPEDATADLEWSRYMASANAVIAGIPIKIVNNNEGGQEKAALDLLRIVEKTNTVDHP
ncbi:MAG TPA: AAA family ATPase, partial [Candidatus Binatus sp.]|nr:AAA family ATPase [Candidatus Binatus sp.]